MIMSFRKNLFIQQEKYRKKFGQCQQRRKDLSRKK